MVLPGSMDSVAPSLTGRHCCPQPQLLKASHIVLTAAIVVTLTASQVSFDVISRIPYMDYFSIQVPLPRVDKQNSPIPSNLKIPAWNSQVRLHFVLDVQYLSVNASIQTPFLMICKRRTGVPKAIPGVNKVRAHIPMVSMVPWMFRGPTKCTCAF